MLTRTRRRTDYRAHTSCISEDQKYQKRFIAQAVAHLRKLIRGPERSVYKGPKAKGQAQAPKPVAAPAPVVPTPTPVPTPAPSTSTLPAVTPTAAAEPDAESKKRARDDAAAVTESKKKSKKDKSAKSAVEGTEPVVAMEVEEPVPSVEGDDDASGTKASKKASKKQRQKEAKALGTPAAVAESSIDPTLSAVALDIPVVEPTPAPAPAAIEAAAAKTVHQFLAPLLPTLLAESRSLAALREIVVAQAAVAGFADEQEVEKVLWEGVWIGGPKPKKQVLLNFERQERATKKGKAKRDSE